MNHSLLYVFLFWLFSNFISALPSADDLKAVGYSAKFLLFYGSLMKFLQISAGNAARVIPQLRILNSTSSDPNQNAKGQNA